jgi:hypothetical protein
MATEGRGAVLLQEPLTFAVAKEREQREHQVRRGTITLAGLIGNYWEISWGQQVHKMTITEQSSFNVFSLAICHYHQVRPQKMVMNNRGKLSWIIYIYNYIYNIYIYTRDHTGLFEHLAPPNPMVWSSLAPFNDDFRVPIFGETNHGWKTNSNR